VPECKHCGAQLPENAKFCFQCGAGVSAETLPAGPQVPLDFLQPALAGGMFLGLLSSMPLISAGNCICCMWVLGGGGIATLLLTKQRPAGITYGDGAFAGVLSGLFGAIIATMVSIPVRVISAGFFQSQQQTLEETLRELGIEGQMHDLMMRMASPEISVVTITFTFFSNLLMYALFAMIGGILTVAILNKKQGGHRPPLQ
jgi:hypothetical protein